MNWKKTLQNACNAIANTAKRVADAFHFHKCPNPRCRQVWKHGEECRGNERAHTCPKCGEEQFYILWSPTPNERRKAKVHGND